MSKSKELWVWTFVFISLLSTIIRSQPLFDDDDVMFHKFHNSMKVEGLKSLLSDTEALLKEKEIKLEEERKEKDSIIGSYVDLLHMYARGIVAQGIFYMHLMNSENLRQYEIMQSRKYLFLNK